MKYTRVSKSSSYTMRSVEPIKKHEMDLIKNNLLL